MNLNIIPLPRKVSFPSDQNFPIQHVTLLAHPETLADPRSFMPVGVAVTEGRNSLIHVHRFTFVGEIQADTLRLTEMGNLEIPPRIMAISLEHPTE